MKDVTKFPHATGTAEIPRPGGNSANLLAHHRAMEEAYVAFVGKYGRSPSWDDVCFRGVHSTTTVVAEIWEKG